VRSLSYDDKNKYSKEKKSEIYQLCFGLDLTER